MADTDAVSVSPTCGRARDLRQARRGRVLRFRRIVRDRLAREGGRRIARRVLERGRIGPRRHGVAHRHRLLRRHRRGQRQRNRAPRERHRVDRARRTVHRHRERARRRLRRRIQRLVVREGENRPVHRGRRERRNHPVLHRRLGLGRRAGARRVHRQHPHRVGRAHREPRYGVTYRRRVAQHRLPGRRLGAVIRLRPRLPLHPVAGHPGPAVARRRRPRHVTARPRGPRRSRPPARPAHPAPPPPPSPSARS